MTSRLLSTGETVGYLRVSKAMVKSYVKHGLLHPVRLPNAKGDGNIRRTLFDIRELDSLIEKGTEGTWADTGMDVSTSQKGEDSITTKTQHSESREHRQKRSPRKKHRSFYDPEIMKLEQDYHLRPLK